MTAQIHLSISINYKLKDGASADDAVHAVTINLHQLLKTAGIDKHGKQTDEHAIPLFCPPPLQRFVEIDFVKPLIVVTPDIGESDDDQPINPT